MQESRWHQSDPKCMYSGKWPKHRRSIHLSPQFIQVPPPIKHRIPEYDTYHTSRRTSQNFSFDLEQAYSTSNLNQSHHYSAATKSTTPSTSTQTPQNHNNVNTHTHHPPQPLPLSAPRTTTPHLTHTLTTSLAPPHHFRLFTLHHPRFLIHSRQSQRRQIHIRHHGNIIRSRCHRCHKDIVATSTRGRTIGAISQGSEDVCYPCREV